MTAMHKRLAEQNRLNIAVISAVSGPAQSSAGTGHSRLDSIAVNFTQFLPLQDRDYIENSIDQFQSIFTPCDLRLLLVRSLYKEAVFLDMTKPELNRREPKIILPKTHFLSMSRNTKTAKPPLQFISPKKSQSFSMS